MTATQDFNTNDLALKVIQLMDNTPHAKVESLLGINKRYLYDIKAGRTNNITPDNWRKAQDYFSNAHEDTKTWQVAVTRNLSIATGTFKRAQTEKLCLALTGTTGFGKTESAKLYRQKTGGVIYVHCNTEMTKSSFLDGILKDLGVAPQHRGITTEAKIHTTIRTILKLENPLFIIDDAGKLRDSAFRMFQILFDEAAGRVGFVLTGVPEFKQKVFRNADKGVFCYREIARRIGWVSLDTINRQDVESICHKNGITDASAISYLCDNVGDFDTLKRLIKAAKTVVNTEGGVIDRAFFASTVGMAVENYRVSYIKS
jgi:hypothetical protein